MLHVPVGSNTFGLMQPSTTGRPAAAQGVSVTPVVGSKGSWAQLIAATTADTFGLLICINSNTTSAASRTSTVDIGIGSAGSEQVLIPDLLCGNASSYVVGGMWFYFPIFIPAGTRIAARAQSTVTTALRVYCQCLGRPANPAQIRKASFVEAYGATPPNGTSITPGTTSDGAWTLIGTTSKPVWWWQIGFQISSADTSHGGNVLHMDVAVGNGTNFDIVMEDAQVVTSTAEAANNPPISAGVEFHADAGTNVYARMQNSGTNDTTLCAVYAAGG